MEVVDIDTKIRAGFYPRQTFRPLPQTLLHSSVIPSPEEEITIRETIQDINVALTSVDAEMHRLQAALSDLEAYRKSLHATIKIQQAPLSTIRRLPLEILREIFLFASAGSGIQLSPGIKPLYPNALQDNMPWLLCRICSYWRAAAISFPKLWSNIHLDLQHSLHRESVKTVFALCLERSKDALLTISLEANGSIIVLSLLNMLAAQSRRWKNISLKSNVFFDFQRQFAQIKNNVPNLRRLYIGATYEYLPQSTPLDVFGDAPSLCELSMEHIINPLQNVRIPWSQITHFTSKGNAFREGEFTQILGQMTNLISFSTEGERILELGLSQPILLSHLQKLTIVNKGSYISKTFQFITAPSLQELSIHAITAFMADHTIAMIRRSQCKPRRLTFHSSLELDAIGDENLGIARVLNVLPSLTHIELHVSKSAHYIIPHLVGFSNPAVPSLLPNLEIFELEDRCCVSAGEITEVLASRITLLHRKNATDSDAPQGLRMINLRLCPPAAPKFPELDLLKTIAENHGIEISILSG